MSNWWKQEYKRSDVVMATLFIVTMVFNIWGVGIYRRTFIPPTYLVIVVVLGAIILLTTLWYTARKYLNTIWSILMAAVIGGGVVYFLTLYLNQELADKQIISKTFAIQETGNLAKGTRGKCRKPFAIINFNGFIKQLIFTCEYEKTITKYNQVKLTYSNGYFGFPIIRSQSLIR